MKHGACAALLLAVLLSAVECQAQAPLPPLDRQLVVGAARFTSTAFLDTGVTIGSLGDSLMFGYAAEMSVLCSSTWNPQWRLFAHLPLVDTANIWYIPLTYRLGTWPALWGDSLVCELWECDGGCQPASPALLPNATAGDDLMGSGTLSMSAFRTDYSQTVDFFTNGTMTGSIYLECANCSALWARPGGWVNPNLAPALPPGPLPASDGSGSGSGGSGGSGFVNGTAASPQPPPNALDSPIPPPSPLTPAASPPTSSPPASPPASPQPPSPIAASPPPQARPTPSSPPPSIPPSSPPAPIALPAVPPPPLAASPPPPASSPPPLAASPPPPASSPPPLAASPPPPASSPPPPLPTPTNTPPPAAPAPAPDISPVGDPLVGEPSSAIPAASDGSAPSPAPAPSGQPASSTLPQQPEFTGVPPTASALPPPPPPPVDMSDAQPRSGASPQKGANSTAIGVAVGVALGLALLAALALCCCCWRRRRRAAAGAFSASGGGEGQQDEFGVSPDMLRIRVVKPVQAEQVMRAARASTGLVATPWRPNMRLPS